MARRTIYLPEAVDQLVRDSLAEGESYSSALCRLVEAGSRLRRPRKPPAYVGSGDGPEDLGRLAERYLADVAATAPGEEHGLSPAES